MLRRSHEVVRGGRVKAERLPQLLLLLQRGRRLAGPPGLAGGHEW